MNSGESYTLVTPDGKSYAWHGSGSETVEKEYSNKVNGILNGGKACVTVKEGEEPQDFWDGLGGKTEYLNYKDLGMPPDFEPRLFDMRHSSEGKFWMNEIHNFS